MKHLRVGQVLKQLRSGGVRFDSYYIKSINELQPIGKVMVLQNIDTKKYIVKDVKCITQFIPLDNKPKSLKSVSYTINGGKIYMAAISGIIVGIMMYDSICI